MAQHRVLHLVVPRNFFAGITETLKSKIPHGQSLTLPIRIPIVDFWIQFVSAPFLSQGLHLHSKVVDRVRKAVSNNDGSVEVVDCPEVILLAYLDERTLVESRALSR